jgi:hypothetical protein
MRIGHSTLHVNISCMLLPILRGRGRNVVLPRTTSIDHLVSNALEVIGQLCDDNVGVSSLDRRVVLITASAGVIKGSDECIPLQLG